MLMEPPPVSAIILAGGGSRRMGRDKALLQVGGKPLIALIVESLKGRFDDILISAGPGDDRRFPGRTVVPDAAPGQGPLMGIATALPRAKHDLAFVIACDIPHIDLGFTERLIELAEGYDLALPDRGDGRYEPLFAVYRKTVAGPARDILAAGGRSILELLDRVRVKLVAVPPDVRIGNINTASDYRRLLRGPSLL
jgi:molybdopterin-guanine dinucleotide biosynthesis protein A